MTIPHPLRCTIEKVTDNGVYLLENGIYMFMYIGLTVDPGWVQAVFGVQVSRLDANCVQIANGSDVFLCRGILRSTWKNRSWKSETIQPLLLFAESLNLFVKRGREIT